MSTMSDNSENLTTDALPSPPLTELKTNTSFKVNKESQYSQKNSDDEDSDHSCSSSKPRKFSTQSFDAAPSNNGVTNVINISHASGIQIGSNYTYIMGNSANENKKNSKFYPKTDKIISLLNSDELFNEKDIELLATHIDETWMDTARKLNYSNGQISQLHCDYINNGLKEVIYQFLLDWFRNNAEKATVGKLANALWKTGQKECVTIWSQK